MQTAGEILKQKRLADGRSVEDIAAVTRIPIDTITAIETDLYDDIPGEVFVKGFLRNYARELQLDEEEILSVYFQARGEAKPVVRKAERIDTPVARHNTPTSPMVDLSILKRFKLSHVLILLVVVLSLVMSFLFLSLDEDDGYSSVKQSNSSQWNQLHDDETPLNNPPTSNTQ